MIRRYVLAKARGKDAYAQVLDEDARLLKRFGLRLVSVSSGVTIAVESELRGKAVHPWNAHEITAGTWEIVHPLLQRLAEAEDRLAQLEKEVAHAAN